MPDTIHCHQPCGVFCVAPSLGKLLAGPERRSLPRPVCAGLNWTLCSLSCCLGPGPRVHPAGGRLLFCGVSCFWTIVKITRCCAGKTCTWAISYRCVLEKSFPPENPDFCPLVRYEERAMDLVMNIRLIVSVKHPPIIYLWWIYSCSMAPEICQFLKRIAFLPSSLPSYLPSFLLFFFSFFPFVLPPSFPFSLPFLACYYVGQMST